MKNLFKKMDKTLFVFMAVYTILGLVMIFSASSISAVLYNKLKESYFFTKQLEFAIAIWLVGLIFIIRFPTSKYQKLGPLIMLGILIALAGLYPYGSITNSAKSWYDLKFFSIQPSEFAKTAIILYLAVYYEKIIKRKDYDNMKIIFPMILVLIATALVVFQPDLGTAIIIAGIAAFIFLALPIENKQMKTMKLTCIIGIIAAATFVVFGGNILKNSNLLTSEQKDRLTYRAPCTRYTDKTGYQVCNGFIAINNGGLFGVGLGNSTQKYLYLPEAYTDFIFPIVIEELGSLVGILIIIGYLIILYRLLKIARNAVNMRGSIIAYGTFAYILLHLLVNFMGILALIPLTGVPVPFLSYGGSFYINLMFLLFTCERVAIETKNNKTKELLRSI